MATSGGLRIQRFAHRVQQICQCLRKSCGICLVASYCIHQYRADYYTIGYPADRGRGFSIPDAEPYAYR